MFFEKFSLVRPSKVDFNNVKGSFCARNKISKELLTLAASLAKSSHSSKLMGTLKV
jgi:hypothetical protein